LVTNQLSRYEEIGSEIDREINDTVAGLPASSRTGIRVPAAAPEPFQQTQCRGLGPADCPAGAKVVRSISGRPLGHRQEYWGDKVDLDLIPNGLAAGSLYALIAVGFNVLYRPTNVFNFAQGDLVMLGAMIAASAIQSHIQSLNRRPLAATPISISTKIRNAAERLAACATKPMLAGPTRMPA
jgi:hypothetical protein